MVNVDLSLNINIKGACVIYNAFAIAKTITIINLHHAKLLNEVCTVVL